MKLSQTQENKNEQCKKNIDPELTENGIRFSYTEQTVGMPEALICQGVTEGGGVVCFFATSTAEKYFAES